jgi:regulator of protease activity HflC (stomatin/prohibitin superfamily)
MFIFIIGILILIGGFIFAAYASKQYKGKPFAMIIRAIACLLCVVAVTGSCISYVPTGYTGIVTTFGKVHDITLDAGINFHAPWDNVITMDNREQRVPFEMQAFSSDIQEVSIRGSVNLNIDKKTAMNLYREVGTDYLNILVTPRISEEIKSVISKYTAEGLITNRNNLSIEMLSLLKDALATQGINILSVTVEDIDFSDAFTNAVEAKQVATQEKQKAQTEQEQKTMEAQQAAERKKIEASAAAEVQKIEADAAAYAVRVQAEAQAEANTKLSTSITEELIKYNYVQTWDGKLPTVSTDNAMSIINIPEITE